MLKIGTKVTVYKGSLGGNRTGTIVGIWGNEKGLGASCIEDIRTYKYVILTEGYSEEVFFQFSSKVFNENGR